MNNLEKYLPIGTVVLLKGGDKKIMITGFGVVTEEDKNKMWDYSACLYPEGMLTSAQTCLFNHDQIEKIYHLGLINEEEIEFKKQFNELINRKGNAQNEEAQQENVQGETREE